MMRPSSSGRSSILSGKAQLQHKPSQVKASQAKPSQVKPSKDQSKSASNTTRASEAAHRTTNTTQGREKENDRGGEGHGSA